MSLSGDTVRSSTEQCLVIVETNNRRLNEKGFEFEIYGRWKSLEPAGDWVLENKIKGAVITTLMKSLDELSGAAQPQGQYVVVWDGKQGQQVIDFPDSVEGACRWWRSALSTRRDSGDWKGPYPILDYSKYPEKVSFADIIADHLKLLESLAKRS